jgi:pimeloyl-ACP methyl ester carboxylesterase
VDPDDEVRQVTTIGMRSVSDVPPGAEGLFHADWGVRAERWGGIRSEWVEVRGTRVHVLRADGPSDGPTQLLIHGLGGAAGNWLEVIPALRARGPVVAPDLPGFGLTRPPRPGATRVRTNAGFVGALTRTLGIEHAEVHGNSMGGLISTLVAHRLPQLVERLVLVDPALPGPRTRMHHLAPMTMLTFAPFAFPGLGRLAMRRLYTTRTAEQLFDENARYIHGDPTRVSPELAAVGRENVAFGQSTDWRLDGFVAAAESIVSMLLGARSLLTAIDGIAAPTLLVWGDADQLVGRPVIDLAAARRPDWDVHTFETVGHAPMIEAPGDYLSVVTDWLDRGALPRPSRQAS